MNLRGTQQGAIMFLVIAAYLAFQHFSRADSLQNAFNQGDKASNGFDNALVGDASERFGKREAEKFHFLGPKERRDAYRKRPGDVNYNPKTLYFPHDFLKSLSGGQMQWWEFKSMNMDKVLFFKV